MYKQHSYKKDCASHSASSQSRKPLVTIIPKPLRVHHRKHPADVETKAETAVALPLIGGLGNKLRFGHTCTVGEMQLKYMPACFNVKANRQRIVAYGSHLPGIIIPCGPVQYGYPLQIKSSAVG